MKYEDFVDAGYIPKKTDLICSFYVESATFSIKKAAGGVAAESSIGTWTELTTEKAYMKKLAAKVFEIKGKNVKIAYPIELFEEGNMPNILSGIAGNIFGLSDLSNIRFNDIEMPSKLIKSFKGPKYGIKGIRKLTGVKKRPLVGTIVKPKLGLNTRDHAEVAYEAWAGGCDIVKDDENLSSQKFNQFENRLKETVRMKRKAEKETGEKKIYMINITAETKKMNERAKLVEKSGNEYAMVDVLTEGWGSLQTLRDEDFDLVLHAHRAGHAAFTKDTKHGISMKVIAKLVRYIGLDQLHVGTAVGKMFETRKDVLENIEALKENIPGMKPALPVASGGLHPGLIPKLVDIFGNDFVLQLGGGIHGNPLGTRRGAMAARQAVDAKLDGISLKEYAKKHEELQAALEKWRIK